MSDQRKWIAEGLLQLPRVGGMLVPGLVVATEELLKEVEMTRAFEQVRNVAHLKGIVGQSIAMPDIHWGYGFPIGGVAATDVETGVISPGGVGYDINCGVRLALAPIAFDSLTEKMREKVLEGLFRAIPSGIGAGKSEREFLKESDYRSLLVEGARWSVRQGFGFEADLKSCESHGKIADADPGAVSSKAKERGGCQLGSIGSGNHFVEVGEVEEIIDEAVAGAWGISSGQLYVLIHSGSRGFGHQVCTDTIEQFLKRGYGEGLPDRQLVSAPFKTPDGQWYFHAMAAAANYAFNNRQQILHSARKVFSEVLGIPGEEIALLYDVCHNIAKVEKHRIEGRERSLCVHRKGATRALGRGSEELADRFKQTGQPVLVPGDMGRASYIMVGEGNPLTFCSACHGAGRARSRHESMRAWKGRDPLRYMRERGVQVRAHSLRTVTEEMPDAYKAVDQVVAAVEQAKLARRVARLHPRLVIKG